MIALLLIYRPRKDERLSWPSWLTCSERFTHIVVTRRLQAERRMVSSPAKDRRSANCATRLTYMWKHSEGEPARDSGLYNTQKNKIALSQSFCPMCVCE